MYRVHAKKCPKSKIVSILNITQDLIVSATNIPKAKKISNQEICKQTGGIQNFIRMKYFLQQL